MSRAALGARWPLEPGDDDLTAGDVTITRFVYAGFPDTESRGHAVADMVPMLRDPTGRVDRDEVTRLAEVSAQFELSGVLIGDRGRLAEVLGLV